MIRKESVFFVFMLLCILVNSPSLGQSLSKVRSKEIDAQVEELMETGDIPGVSLVIVLEDQNIVKSYGYANVETSQKVTSKTLFELASCSKAFTALAIMNLVERGELDLKSDVSNYLPGFKVSFDGKPVNITVEQLLHHTSGIPWNTLAKIPESNSRYALEKTVAVLRDQELSKLPGKEFEYATINYDVLALILEKVTGEVFETYMQKSILDRIGLINTTVGRPKRGAPIAKGYKISFFEPRPFNAPRYKGNNAAGYIVSNAEDITKWLQLQLQLKETEFKASIAATHLRDSTVPVHGMSSYGKGWYVLLDGSNQIFHSGLNPNFSSHIILNPTKKIGIAVMANANSGNTKNIGIQAMNLLLGEELEEDLIVTDRGDRIFSMLSLAISFFIILVISYILWSARDIIRKNRVFLGVRWEKINLLFAPVLIAIPLAVGIYLLPEAVAGFNWRSILVWTPASAEALLKLVVLAWIICYLAFALGFFFPEKNEYKRGIPQIILFSTLSGCANVLVIIMVTSALNSPMELKFLVFYYCLVLLIYLLGKRFVQIKLTKTTVNLVYDMRMKVLSKVLMTSYQKLEKIENGRIFTVINDDTTSIGSSAQLFVRLVTSFITIVGSCVYMLSISLWATAVVVSVMIMLIVIYYFVSQSANPYYEEARDERNIFMGLIDGLVNGLKEISQHRRKKGAYKEDLSGSASRFKNKNLTAAIKFINGVLFGESLLLILLGIVAIGLPWLFPNISFFTLMSFVIVLLYLIPPINGVLNSIPEVMQLRVSWRRIQLFLKEIPADLNLTKRLKPDTIKHKIKRIKVQDVHFNYGNVDFSQGSFSLGPVDFEINAGEVLFISGGNGSGKTTLAKILTGLYKPDKGSILIDEKKIANVELGEYFSTVFNPPYLFKKLYGIDTSKKGQLIDDLLKLLHLDHKVKVVNNEFSTLELSSGQRKRLGLLQCYLEDAPIYLFDEWAADQDPEFRYFFYRRLIPDMKALGKTIIAISHDDFYFNVADRIIKMREGKMEIIDTKKVMLPS